MITRFFLSFVGGLFNAALGFAMMGALLALAVVLKLNEGLPSTEDLLHYNPPTLSRVYDGTGALMDEFAQQRRIFTDIEDTPKVLIQAVISAEDKNFYRHEGYDLRAIGAAVYEMVESRGSDARGASTITQQVIKNFLLTNERTMERKARELLLAYKIEQTLSKDEILELYLNEIFLGQNSYGMAAAALTYFNTPLSEITLAQAAYLAALPQRPSSLHPVRDREEALKRRAYVLDQMALNGYVTPAEANAAKADPLDTVQGGQIRSSRADLPARDYFTDEIRRQIEAALGADVVNRGGLQIRATIDHELQDAAREALRNGLLRLDRQAGIWRGTGLSAFPEGDASPEAWGRALAALTLARDIPGWHAGTVARIDPQGAYVAFEVSGTVAVGFIPAAEGREWPRVQRKGEALRASGGLADLLRPGDVIHVEMGEGEHEGFPVLGLRQVPAVEGALLAADVRTGRILAIQGGFSFGKSSFNRATQALRQTGSSFKPFLYAAALERGATPDSMYDDVAKTIWVGRQSWTPKNASGRSYGRVSMRTAMARSLNLATLDIGQSIGLDAVAEMAERLGVYERMGRFPANMLGSQETTLYNMVRAYATFAAGGEKVDLSLVDRVQDRFGKTIYRHGPLVCVDCDSPTLAAEVPTVVALPRPRLVSTEVATEMTEMLQEVITGGTGSRVKLPDPVAGKTGTTNDAQDVWFVGYTPGIVAGCYVGFDKPYPLGPGAGGGSVCGPIFEEFMKVAMARYPSGDFGAVATPVEGDVPQDAAPQAPEWAPVDMDALVAQAPEDPLVAALATALGQDVPGGEGAVLVDPSTGFPIEGINGDTLVLPPPPIATPGVLVPLLAPSEQDKADRDRFISFGHDGPL